MKHVESTQNGENLDKCDLLVFERTAVGALEVHFLVPKRFGTSPAIVFAVDVPRYSWNSSAVRIVNSNVWCKCLNVSVQIQKNHCFQVNLPWIYHDYHLNGISKSDLFDLGFPNRGCHPSRPSTPRPPHPVIGSELRPQHHSKSGKIISKKYRCQVHIIKKLIDNYLTLVKKNIADSVTWHFVLLWLFWGKHALWPIPKRAVKTSPSISARVETIRWVLGFN